MRKVAYYRNVSSAFGKICQIYYGFMFHRAGRILGFSIGFDSCGPGLSLPHYGTIIISGEARLGANCRVHACVTIGANATVNKSVEQEYVVVAGTPAKIVKIDYPNWLEFNKEKHYCPVKVDK